MSNISNEKILDSYQIICAILDYYRLNSKQFCTKIGVNLTYVNDAKKGKTKKITNDVADKILYQFPNLNRIWLITGEGEMYLHKNTSNTAIGNSNVGSIVQGHTIETPQPSADINRLIDAISTLTTANQSQANTLAQQSEQISKLISLLESRMKSD